MSVRKNGVAAMSCTISAGATACETTGSVAVADGGFLQVRAAGTGANRGFKAYVTLS